MSITIDSMIWIFLYDPKAKEHQNVKQWMFGKEPVLQKYTEIVLNSIIPLEVLHSFNKNQKVDYSVAYNAIMAIIALEPVTIVDVDSILLKNTIQILGKYRSYGIGARDASIIASMVQKNVPTLVTHDKNMLMISDFQRIDPVFSIPLILQTNEKFDEENFSLLLKKHGLI